MQAGQGSEIERVFAEASRVEAGGRNARSHMNGRAAHVGNASAARLQLWRCLTNTSFKNSIFLSLLSLI
jgi:hypothetical protein